MTETTAQKCSRHPDVDTLLTCVRCGTPICPQCMAYTPNGGYCPACVAAREHTAVAIPAWRLLVVALAGVVLGVLGGALVYMCYLPFQMWCLLPGVVYSRYIGALMLVLGGRRVTRSLEITCGVTLFLGALAGRLMGAVQFYHYRLEHGYLVWPWHLTWEIANPYSIICALVVALGATSRLRSSWGFLRM